jgi:hypothetical protein
MKLPNGDRAIIPDEKLTNYILNPDHEEHGGHAELFRLLLGIERSNADDLKTALADAAATAEAIPGRRSPFGEKYEVRFTMQRASTAYTILSVWIIRAGEQEPRLVTAFVE